MFNYAPLICSLLLHALAEVSGYIYNSIGPAQCGATYEVDDNGLWLSFEGYRLNGGFRLLPISPSLTCIVNLVVRPNLLRNKLTITIESLETPDPTVDCGNGNYMEVITSFNSEIVCGRWSVYRRNDLRDRTNMFSDDLGRISLRLRSTEAFNRFRFSLIAVAYADDRYCQDSEYRCWEDNIIRCIHYRFRCNGHYDCGLQSGSDEYECILTTGAITGMAVATLILIILVAGLVAWCCKKRGSSIESPPPTLPKSSYFNHRYTPGRHFGGT